MGQGLSDVLCVLYLSSVGETIYTVATRMTSRGNHLGQYPAFATS